MQVTKIKILKNGNVGIAFKILLRTEGEIEFWTKATIVSNEEIHQLLANILVNLRPHVVELLELPKSEDSRIKVMGAEFTMTEKEGIFGAQIYALRKLDHATIPQEIITPHKTEVPYSDSRGVDGPEPEQILDSQCVVLLKQLRSEAEEYVLNQKDQIGLFDNLPETKSRKRRKNPKTNRDKN